MSRMFSWLLLLLLLLLWAVPAIMTSPERRRGREEERAWHSWQYTSRRRMRSGCRPPAPRPHWASSYRYNSCLKHSSRSGTTAAWNTAADQVQQLPETQQLIRHNSCLKHSSWSGTTAAWNTAADQVTQRSETAADQVQQQSETAADQVQQLSETQQLIRYNSCLKHSSWSGNTKVWNSSGSGTTAAWNSSWSGTTAVWKSSWSVTTAVWSNSWSGTAAVWNSTWSGATSVWNSSWSGTTAKMIQMPPQCCHCQRRRLTPKYQVIKLSTNRTADLLKWLYEKEQLTNWPAQHSWSDKATVSNRQLIILHWAL